MKFLTGTEKNLIKLKEIQGTIKIVMFVVFFIAELLFIGKLAYDYGLLGEIQKHGKKDVAVIKIDKPITSTYIYNIIKKLDDIKNDKQYAQVLIEMSSPGGSPTASEELSEYLKDFQKNKKVTMYITDMAASGGYYIASSVKPLIANKNAIVGSIGVIMPHYVIEKLASKIGVESDNLSAGKYKEPISLFKKVDEKDKEYLNKHLLSPAYKNFVQSVADNRGLPYKDILKVADGKIFIANMPEIKSILIDKISSLVKVRKEIKDDIIRHSKHKDLKAKDIAFIDIQTNPKNKKSLLGFNIKLNNTTLESVLCNLRLQ